MIPANYQCEGQLNLWDYLKEEEPKESDPPKQDSDDSICEGCKWREWEGRQLEVDEHGYTWVYCCPGTACANWKHGTPLNLTCEAEGMTMLEYDFQERTDFPYCYNNDFLLHFEDCVKMIEDEFGIKFEMYYGDWNLPDNPNIYRYRFNKDCEMEISEGTWQQTGKKHISVGWQGDRCGFMSGCDNLEEIRKAVKRAFEKYEEYKTKKKKKKESL